MREQLRQAGDYLWDLAGLLRDPARREAMGASARALVEREYSWERIGEQFEKAYVAASERRNAVRGQEQRSG